jgi:hypothetical protein
MKIRTTSRDKRGLEIELGVEVSGTRVNFSNVVESKKFISVFNNACSNFSSGYHSTLSKLRNTFLWDGFIVEFNKY